jgi:hypothetical protein
MAKVTDCNQHDHRVAEVVSGREMQVRSRDGAPMCFGTSAGRPLPFLPTSSHFLFPAHHDFSKPSAQDNHLTYLATWRGDSKEAPDRTTFPWEIGAALVATLDLLSAMTAVIIHLSLPVAYLKVATSVAAAQ